MPANDEHLIRLPLKPSKQDCVDAFWKWVGILARDDFVGAVDSLRWSDRGGHTPDSLKESVTTFFGGDKPWSVVMPNARLIGVISEHFEFEQIDDRPSVWQWWRKKPTSNRAWFRGMIPLTNEPANPLDDGLPLMGLAVSFGVRPEGDSCVLHFELFYA